jgi:hypothetical protein
MRLHLASASLLALVASLYAPSIFASTTTSTVSQILLDSGSNLVYVYPAGGIPGVPACGAGEPYYSFSFTRSMASAYLAGLLSAQAPEGRP